MFCDRLSAGGCNRSRRCPRHHVCLSSEERSKWSQTALRPLCLCGSFVPTHASVLVWLLHLHSAPSWPIHPRALLHPLLPPPRRPLRDYHFHWSPPHLPLRQPLQWCPTPPSTPTQSSSCPCLSYPSVPTCHRRSHRLTPLGVPPFPLGMSYPTSTIVQTMPNHA